MCACVYIYIISHMPEIIVYAMYYFILHISNNILLSYIYGNNNTMIYY